MPLQNLEIICQTSDDCFHSTHLKKGIWQSKLSSPERDLPTNKDTNQKSASDSALLSLISCTSQRWNRAVANFCSLPQSLCPFPIVMLLVHLHSSEKGFMDGSCRRVAGKIQICTTEPGKMPSCYHTCRTSFLF